MELNKIYEIISSQLNIEPEDISEDSNIREDLGADSLDIFQIACSIEEVFDIEIADNISEDIITVKDLANYLSRYQV